MINQVQAHALPSDIWGVILTGSTAKELSCQSRVCKLFYEIIGGEGFREVWQRETQIHYPNKVHFKFMTKENDWRVAFLRFATFQVNLTRRDREPSNANQLLWAKSHIDGVIHYMWEWNKGKDKDEDAEADAQRIIENGEAFQLLKSFEIPKGSDSKVPKTTELEIHYYLGLCYEKGIGVDQDWPTAIDYHSKASENNYPKSKFRLGFLYDHSIPNDISTQQANFIAAFHNYQSAADLGHAMAQCVKGVRAQDLYDSEDEDGNLSLVIEELSYIAYDAFEDAALQGFGLGQLLTAKCYRYGTGVEKNKKLALQYLHLAAGQGYPSAYRVLSEMYEFGEGVEMDIDKAIEYLHLAADHGNARACGELANRYEEGEGVEMNIDKAIYYLEKQVAEKGEFISAYNEYELKTLKKTRLENAEHPSAKGQTLD